MSVEIQEKQQGRYLDVNLTGKLRREDYEMFVPELERQIEKHGKVRIRVDLRDFHGWEGGGLWEDIKLNLKHFNDIEKVAMVGDSKWQKGMSAFCKPFTTAEIEYFPPDQAEQADQWVRS
ncbi:MAG: STAS/SEC14 domain-containing protein [Phycisphaerae bacterium]